MRTEPFDWVPADMPRLPRSCLDGVCYLFPSEEAARTGKESGGTGFVVGMPSIDPKRIFPYVVTNHHVACTGGNSVIRLNTKDGGSDILDFGPDQWYFDPKYDIAVRSLPLDHERHTSAYISTDGFITKEMLEKHEIGVGEDVFMVGRFIDHDGGAINQPAARFGNLSVMPSPIQQPNGTMAEAYCIDLHSRSGYSGSPVFIYRTTGFGAWSDPNDLMIEKGILGLLGIHFAQFPELWEISSGINKVRAPASSVPLIVEGAYVKGLSGMSCVLPAWCILEVLDSPKLRDARNAANG